MAEEEVYILAKLSSNVYYLDSGASEKKLNEGAQGYSIIMDSIKGGSGLCCRMAVWERDGKRILVIKGTSEGNDYAQDVAMVTGGAGCMVAIQPSLNMARRLISNYGCDLVTGHSLGGYVAEIVGTNDGLPGIAFCGPGVNGPHVSLGGSETRGFRNINFENDPIGNVACGVYTHVQWSVYVKGSTHEIDRMVSYFRDKRHITNQNVVSCSESWATGYYYPK